jgi:N-acetylglucosamine kinase-like BadF-type ATPase
MSFFLALDAGGTKTDYVLADETRELARVRTGTIKRMRVDAVTACQNLESALAELSARTGISMANVTRTCVGTAGETVPLVKDWLRESISARVGGGLLILGDVEIALEAAFPGQAGVLVLAGTGSNVVGRTSGGELISAGGWGPALADQGSGHRIGLESLRAIFLAKDEERETLLLPAVLDFWQLSSLDHLVEHANALPAPDFSTLTGVVLSCAEQGDEIASAVLRKQGDDLAYLVRLVIRRLCRASSERRWTPPIAFAGSILENVPPVRDALMAAVQREFPTIQAPEKGVDPINGALWRARTGSFT